MVDQINPRVTPHIASKVLALEGKSGDDFYVRAIEIDSRIKRWAITVFGSMARLVTYVCRKHVPNCVQLLALQAINGVSFEVIERDKVKEGLVGVCRYVPYAGMAVGVVAGLAYKWMTGGVAPVCGLGILSQTVQAVNWMKQWEIKKIAYLTPLIIPAAIHLVYNLGFGAEDKFLQRAVQLIKFGLEHKLKDEPNQRSMAVVALEVSRWVVSILKVVKETVKTRLPYLISVGALGLSNGLFTRAARYFVPGFDLSGHCFLKTASAALLSSELRAVSKKASTSGAWTLAAYAALYAMSDAVLMFNTVAHHHTMAETVAGVASAALGIWQLDSATRYARRQVENE